MNTLSRHCTLPVSTRLPPPSPGLPLYLPTSSSLLLLLLAHFFSVAENLLGCGDEANSSGPICVHNSRFYCNSCKVVLQHWEIVKRLPWCTHSASYYMLISWRKRELLILWVKLTIFVRYCGAEQIVNRCDATWPANLDQLCSSEPLGAIDAQCFLWSRPLEHLLVLNDWERSRARSTFWSAYNWYCQLREGKRRQRGLSYFFISLFILGKSFGSWSIRLILFYSFSFIRRSLPNQLL